MSVLVIEYIEGQNLFDQLASRKLTVRDSVGIVTKVL